MANTEVIEPNITVVGHLDGSDVRSPSGLLTWYICEDVVLRSIVPKVWDNCSISMVSLQLQL